MTRRRFEGDPIEALRRADPLDPREAPPDTSGQHARALFQEVTSMQATDKGTAPQRRRPLLQKVALGAAAAVVVAAVAVGAYALFGDNAGNVVGGEAVGGDPMAMCLQYTDETLAGLGMAFDGTLVSATESGAEVVFEVHRWFKGGEGTQVTLSAEGLINSDSIALVGAHLEVGQRYLVSADEGYVWACGYTLTYDTALAEHWAELFGA
jgi:hypothetical protein